MEAFLDFDEKSFVFVAGFAVVPLFRGSAADFNQASTTVQTLFWCSIKDQRGTEHPARGDRWVKLKRAHEMLRCLLFLNVLQL